MNVFFFEFLDTLDATNYFEKKNSLTGFEEGNNNVQAISLYRFQIGVP